MDGENKEWAEPSLGEMPSLGEFIGSPTVWPLLPLPFPDVVQWKPRRSCRLRQRQKRRLQVRRAAVGLIKVINALHHGQASSVLTTPGAKVGSRMKVTSARSLALSHLLSRVALMVRERRGLALTGVQALASLLKAPLDESGYVRPTGVRQVSMIADNMVEPKEDKCICMLQALPREDASYYQLEDNVVETRGKCSVIFEETERHYGFIGGELQEFLKYLRRPDVQPLWEWDLMSNIRAIAGVSTVLKKNGVDQRKLIMQCAANYMFGDPTERAHLGMGGGSSLARVFVASDHMHVAACDEDSAFTYVKVPAWMARWQAAPPVLASTAWDLLDDTLRAKIDSPTSTFVAPKYLRLAMGGSHSVYILMRINIQHIGNTLFNYAARLKLTDEFSEVETDMQGADGLPDDPPLEMMTDDAWVHRQQVRRLQLCGQSGWTVDQWCDTVRRSKQLGTRVFVVIHMFAGERRSGDIQDYLQQMMEAEGLELLMLSVDLAEDPAWDFTCQTTVHRIMGLAEEGLIDAWIGGPPCSTVARSRFVKIRHGPRPLRFRWALWGRPDLRPHERARVHEANSLWLNFLMVAEAVASRGGCYFWEHPADLGVSPYPSIWATDEMQQFEERVNGRRIHFHQCPFGGITAKLTTVSANLLGMEALDGVRCPGISQSHQHGVSIGRCPEGGFYTRRLQTYPPRLCQELAKMLFITLRHFATLNVGPTGALTLPDDVPAPRVTAWSTFGSRKAPGVVLLNEATARSYSVSVDDTQSAVYIHVDDTVLVSSGSPGAIHCDRLLDETVNGLGAVGFQVTQQYRAGELDKVVGYEVIPRPAEFRLPKRKMALANQALLFLAEQRTVQVDVLRSLLGMWTFGSLLRRELLSIPHAVFRFIEKHEGTVATWWPVARDEVRAMAHVTCLMTCHVGAPILPWLFGTDAMGENEHDWGGYGIVATELLAGETDSLLQQGEAIGRSVARLDGGGAKYPHKALRPTVPFTMLPESMFAADRWLPVERGRWRYGDHITIGESRTVLKLLRRLGAWPSLHGKVVFSLQDNMPTSCAMTKGRSPSFSLNRILRMKAAVCLSGRLRAFLPWVESERQPADELSRLLW